MSRVDMTQSRVEADPPSVACFRAFVAAVHRGSLKDIIACQRELRRHGYAVFCVASRHRAPDRPRRDVP